METARILGLEWYRWLLFLFAWLPWLLIEIWYFVRMKERFGDEDESGPERLRGEDSDDGV